MGFQRVHSYLFSNRLPRNQLRLQGDEQRDVRAFTQASDRVKTPLHHHASLLAIAQEHWGNIDLKRSIDLWRKYNSVSVLVRVRESGHVWMWELDHKEGWAPKNRCFWTVVLEKTLESPLDCKEIQLVHHKGNQSWMFAGRTDTEVETPTLWPPDVTSWLIWKAPDAGKDWGQEEKGTTEDEMVGWHRLDGLEFE